MNLDVMKKYIHPMTPVPTGFEPFGELTDPVKCVLFDVYGTLFISGSGDIGIAMDRLDQSPALSKLMPEYQIRMSPADLLARYFQAIQDTHGAMKKQGVSHPEVRIDEIWTRVLKIKDQDRIKHFALEFEMLVNPVYPMPHVSDLLNACKAGDIRMGIVSNAQFYTPLIFKLFLGATPPGLGFDPGLIVYSFQFRRAKPSSALFEAVAAQLKTLGIDKKHVLYLGNDMLNDIHGARESGLKTALFAGDRRSLRLRKDDPRCKDLKPDVMITELRQLIQYF